MKNLSKILCAVLVLAMLCSSLIFMVGAEEEEATPAYTSVPADTQMTKDAVLYSAEDNLITYFSRSTNTANGWNGDQARQAYVVTNNVNGQTYYHEWFKDDTYLLKDGGEPAGVGGNEYIQFNFAKQSLVYEEGYHEYIIVDVDLAHQPKTVKIWNKDAYTDTSVTKQEVIARGDAGTSWATVQNYKDFGLGTGFKHVTTVYDYTSGHAYVFVNGKLACTYTNGATTAKVHSAYINDGANVTVEEWRIGSNSADEFHMDNAYVRYAKNANADDTIAAAIASGDLSAWSGNIYDDNYEMPVPYWFVKTAEHTVVADYTNKINNTTATVVDNTVAGNLYVGSSTSIGNGFDVLGVTQTTADDLTYVTFYGARTGSTEKKNIFWQFNTVGAPNVSVEAGTSAYYVVDFDIATHGEVLPYVDISVMLRRVSDGGGFPFSVNIEVAPYIDPNSAWNHITVVGDMAANQCYVYVNGVYAGNPGYAYNADQLSGNTELSPKGIRVDLGLTTDSYDVVAGQNIAFDNFAERVYTNATASNGLDAAVAAGDLNGWANHTNGNGGRNLPVIATVNGVKYYNSTELSHALSSNDKLEVEYFSVPFAPATLHASATIKTNGFEVDKLFTLDPECEILSNEDGVIKTYAPFAENVSAEQVVTVGVANISSVVNAIKYNVSGNLFSGFNPMSLQVNGNYQPTWGNPGFRHGELVTNADTGDVFYRESGIPFADGTMAEGVVLDADNNIISFKEADKGSNTFVRSNEYTNFKFTKTNLKYEAGKNEYIVVDFDFATYEALEDPLCFQIIPRVSGSGSWASDIIIKDIPGLTPGEMAHLTIVFDYSTNNAHVFVNGAYASTVAEGAMDGDFSGDRTDGSKWADRYLAGEAFTVEEFKLCSDRKISTVCIDNMAIRAYDLATSEDVIGAAVQAGDITAWADSIYNAEYVISKLPAVATVDGVDYGSVDALNAALATETGAVKNVNIKHTPDATIKVMTEATVETNGLAVEFDYKTGLYQFHHDDPYYVCTGTDYAYASNRLVMAHDDSSTVYNFDTINQNNADAHAIPVVWFYSLEPEQVEVVYYVFGDEIVPLQNKAYIEDGKLMKDEWSIMDQDYNVGEKVESFPVSSKALSETWYLHSSTVTEVDFAATDIKQSANVSANGELVIYVNKSQTVTDGSVTVIDGVEYITYSFEFAPSEFNKNFAVEFVVEDENGKQYVQKQNVSFIDYAADILADDSQTASVKELVVSLLAYSNEAHKLFKGETDPAADALLAANTAPAGTPSEVYNTTNLSVVIRSAAMKLNNTPEFVFKVARGFKGTIEFTYTGVNGNVKVTKAVDASACEQLVVLDSFDVADIFEDINIVATYENGNTVSGKYNLSTYAAGLENPAFANALLAYSQAAKAYKSQFALYDENGKFNVTRIYNEEDVRSAVLRSVVASKIKQFDQATLADPGNTANGYFTKEGGAPVFVIAPNGTNFVEALYFSRDTKYDWTTYGHAGQNYGFSEFRLDTQGAKITSITFEYVINGVTEVSNSTKPYYGESFESPLQTTSYVEVKIGSGYYQLRDSEMIADGQWHTMTLDLGEGAELSNVLFKLYHFNGEMLLANIAYTYA